MNWRLETDWQAVAMFLAGVIVEEHPSYAPLILQVVDDHTKPVSTRPCALYDSTRKDKA